MTTLSDEVTGVAAPEAPADATEALAERLFLATIDFLEIASIHVGRKLGYCAELATSGPATAAELARRTRTARRYAQEWLEQQTTAGFLESDDPEADPAARTYHLPEAHRPVFVDAEHLNLVAPLATLAVGVLRPFDALIAAYRSGSGVPYEDYGEDLVEGIGAINRPQFVNEMAGWLSSVPDVDARLRRQPPAHVADVACGTAWSSIAMARACPDITVDALDIDEASIAVAQRNVSEAGLSERVRPAVHDASAPQLPDRYELVTIFEALHDMNHPVEALRATRTSLTEMGCVIVADEKVADGSHPTVTSWSASTTAGACCTAWPSACSTLTRPGPGPRSGPTCSAAMQPRQASPEWMCCRSTIHSGGSTGSGPDRSPGRRNPALHRRYAVRGPRPGGDSRLECVSR